MLISYDFPLEYCNSKLEKRYNDYIYCRADRYLLYPEYKDFIDHRDEYRVSIYVDHGNIASNLYMEVLKEIKALYYVVPELDLHSAVVFHEDVIQALGYSIKPIVKARGNTIFELHKSVRDILEAFPNNSALIMLSANEEAFKNIREEEGYFNPKDIEYEPLRMALNRRLVVRELLNRFKDIRIHLDGCKSLAEFSVWAPNPKDTGVYSMYTSHPIDMSVEGPCNKYTWGFFTYNKKKHPMIEYCPEVQDCFTTDFTAMKENIYRASIDEDFEVNLDTFYSTVKNNSNFQ